MDRPVVIKTLAPRPDAWHYNPVQAGAPGDNPHACAEEVEVLRGQMEAAQVRQCI